MRSVMSVRLRLSLLAAVTALALGANPAWAASPNLVISQVYGGGGNVGATYTHDFIEIFNRGNTTVDLNGMSVQYQSAADLTWQKTDIGGQVLFPGQHYLIWEASGGGGTTPLPPPNAIGDIQMNEASGKVALVSNQTLLSCGATTNDCFPNAAIVDFVGYGAAANNSEGAPTATLSNTNAAHRLDEGCTDTDNNAADFGVGAPIPRNGLSGFHFCGGDAGPAITGHSPDDGANDVAVDSNVSIAFSEPVNVSGAWFSISCSSSGSHTATVSGGPTTLTLNPETDFTTGETCTVTVFGGQVSDQDTVDPPDNVAGNPAWSFSTVALVNTAPMADAGGPYTVAEGASISLAASGSDADGDALTYAWDLDNNGTFETTGQSPMLSAAALDGPSTHTVAVRVSDGIDSTTDTATVNVTNVAPEAAFTAPATMLAGFPFVLALSAATDPSAADTAAGFTYAFDCGDGLGYGQFGSTSSATCPTSTTGERTVRGKVQDKDGGAREYTASVVVSVTFASLCALVEVYSSDANVAAALCDKLAKAESAPTATARAGHLTAFRNQVDAKTGGQPGKAFTAAEGALLRQLATQV